MSYDLDLRKHYRMIAELVKLPGNVDQYKVSYYGSVGLPLLPSIIWLYYGEERIASVGFMDSWSSWYAEKEDEMHLPAAMFENVIDILRSERPILFHFKDGHTFLATRAEPVGEAE